ncbi:ANL family adenylate-forming protein [Acidaminobacter hydrogenoformans]|uniref:Acyl-CoA synthetase (AMP-forming)/AMP-acid ligase II n=1 Tax=Acidaminobacter hydrogenoformans DSM 2784 TaxID=1120920 RepID=A0A1G5RQD1_9FIRM|nr:fatty acid--CoA ligase family protein [Acidaminobacter hydrogenoformans]SCZ76060.1 Acyl-CoA synthetase (AMP-forming)/AMP-acid ligase II [Acidaminobacter hydrogenoformans DSM 2784]
MNIDFIKNSLKANEASIAIVTPAKAYTYMEIMERYEDNLSFFRENNIAPGSVVALHADYSADAIAAMLALIENDCILVPISKTILNIEKFMQVSQSEFIIEYSDELKVFKATGIHPTHPMIQEIQKRQAPGLVLFSSGTTGDPKAALHDLTKLLEKFKKTGKTFKTITFLLFDHIGGFNTLLHTLSHGGTIVTIPNRVPAQVCEIIEKEKIELLPTTPTFLNMILLNKLYEQYDLTCLKMITYGTESMPEYTLKLFSKILPNTTFKQTYGLSELGIMATKSERSDSLWMKLGGDGFETKIVEEVLYIRAESAMLGYLNAPSPFDEEGWFNTKDRVEEKDGFLRILGRTSDLINVGGEKVYPIEIENVLLQISGVLDARVFAEKNSIMGNTVAAEILVAPENNNNEFKKILRHFCSENLERFKRPTRFILNEKELYTDRLKKKH